MSSRSIQQPGFLIDLDGLLINSEELSKIAFEQLCKELVCEFTDNYHSKIRGKRKSQWAREFVEEFHLAATAEEVADRHTELLIEELNRSVQLMPGAEDLLNWIQEKDHVSALVTSSDREYASVYTFKLGIDRFFDSIVTAEDVRNGKPDPEPYLVGARKIDRDPKNCIVLEDSVNGVLAGKASGAIVIAVPSTGSDCEKMQNPDYIVPSLVEALQIVKGMGL